MKYVMPGTWTRSFRQRHSGCYRRGTDEDRSQRQSRPRSSYLHILRIGPRPSKSEARLSVWYLLQSNECFARLLTGGCDHSWGLCPIIMFGYGHIDTDS